MRNLACCIVAATAVGCLAHPDYNGRERLTDYTAYALRPGDFQAGVGVVGTSFDDLGASGRFEAGVVKGLQLGTNVVHDAFGLVNVAAKYALPDVSRFTFSAGLGFKWFNPRMLWVVPEDTRDRYSGVNVFMVPATATASYAPFSWMGVHLRLGYTWSGMDGKLPAGDALVEAGFGGHEVKVQPTLTFYPLHGWAIIAGAEVPLYSVTGAAVQAETVLAPGVVAGGAASGEQRRDVWGRNTVYVATELCFGRTNVRLSVTRGLRFFERQLGVLPAAEVYWRF